MVLVTASSSIAAEHDGDGGDGDRRGGDQAGAARGDGRDRGRRGDGPAPPAARPVAGRPGGHGQALEVDQQLVGYVDREARHDPGGEHRADEQQRPGHGRREAEQAGDAGDAVKIAPPAIIQTRRPSSTSLTEGAGDAGGHGARRAR